MAQSYPPNLDPRRNRTFSGLTVILGLVLLVIACTALAVASYLALGPMSFRRQAITRAIEEDAQASRQRNADADAAGGTVAADALNPVNPVNTDPSSEPPPDPAAASLTELTPIEVIGSGINAGDWHAAVACGQQSFRQAIALRPVEDGGSTQIAFELKARFVQLRGSAATVGRQTGDSAAVSQDHPRAVFRIYGDGNLLWESERLIGPGKCQSFQCDLRGVDVLTLTAESESPASLSQLAWGNPTLVAASTAERGRAP